jgi:hypothetical protein
MRPEELIDKIKEFIDNNNHELGFEYITFGDGILIPKYPACLIVYDGLVRNIHGTHYFLTGLQVQIVVMHADLTANRQERTREDLVFATKVVHLLHGKGLTLMDQRIHKSFVTSEEPALISTDNITAIGTTLTVIAEVREAFK